MMYTDLLGVKYTVHGRSKEEGFDCYGLAIEVLKRNGIILEDLILNPKEGKINAEEIQTVENLCLIEMEKGHQYHIAVYIGDGLLIHSRKGFGVCIEPLYRYNAYVRRYLRVC